MLPSMPILFSRDSQEAFGSRLQPGTSFFSQNFGTKQVIPEVAAEAPPVVPKQPETKNKTDPEKKKKNDPPNIDDNALENAFVRSYYHRVQSRFTANQSVPTNKFAQFQNILRDFNPNTESPSQLYKKIEDLFGEEHKDIVEDFLLFLKPEQALEVGRFMDRFQLAQMTSFLNMLHTTFARKPTVLRKVMRALTTALNNGTSEEVKARVLPHFRSNPRLTRVFKSLFPDERPADSLYESGVDMANESFLTADKGYDVWEFDDDTETKKRKTKEGLDTLYMNGRVFLQHGRLLRSARVTFPYSKEPYRVHARRLAPSHEPSPPQSDDETPPKEIPKKIPPKRPRKQTKSPTKKDVNDNTKNNCQLSPKPKKSQKIKNGKKELDGNAPKRKDKQSAKKEDVPKSKHAKIEVELKTDIEARMEIPIKVEPKTEATIKGEPKTITSIKVEPKPVHSIKVEPKTVASMKIEPKTVTAIKVEPKVVAPLKPKIEFVNPEAKVETVNVRTGIAPVCVETKKIEEKSNNWTRDEDKTMLQVLKGEAGSEKVFGKIRELLPHRSATEIKERFCHVMTLLQQMGEVT